MGAVHRRTVQCINHILVVALIQIGSLASNSATPDFLQVERWAQLVLRRQSTALYCAQNNA